MILADNFNTSRFPRRALFNKIAKAVFDLKAMLVVGRPTLNGSSCFHNNIRNKNKQYAERMKGPALIPGTIFGRAFRQSLTGATFSNSNSISPKNDIVSKQFPCMRDTKWYSSKLIEWFDRVRKR
jgi:hypothetical protein